MTFFCLSKKEDRRVLFICMWKERDIKLIVEYAGAAKNREGKNHFFLVFFFCPTKNANNIHANSVHAYAVTKQALTCVACLCVS
jgi:hypothetical protein